MADTHGGLWDREVESATVAGSLNGLTRGGGVLLLEGPAGIGKTRLLATTGEAATQSGAIVLSARGTQLESDFAFGVVRQLFELLLAGANPARLERLWQGPASQARSVFATASIGTGAGPAGDFAVLHGLYWLTANACQEQPLVLLVDDLQWCDAPSLRYLAYLLPRLEDLGVLVAAALRTSEPATDERLLQHITTDPTAQILRPRPLSTHTSALLLQQALSDEVDPAFAAACHQATGGNPLLLHELARTLTAEHIKASADNVALIPKLGSRAVARLVAVRMADLPSSTVALARAAAVLGDHADLTTAAALARQDTTTALEGVTTLEKLQILRAEKDRTATHLSFIHPLVQAAVHDSIDHADLANAHHHAAQLLTTPDADPERIAAHLLRTLPAADPDTVAALRTAAAAATGRGAPTGAYNYLRRALAEPPTNDQYPHVLLETGRAALLVDLPAAARLLQQAFESTNDPVARADIAAELGTAHMYLLNHDRGFNVWDTALKALPAQEKDRRQHLEASLLVTATWYVPGRSDILDRLPEPCDRPTYNTTGGRLLDCAIASRAMTLCEPAAVPLARAALSDGTLIQRAAGDPALIGGWNTLISADDELVAMDSLHKAVQHAHLRGSLQAPSPAYDLRAYAWLCRGQLTEVEHDAREALRTAALVGAAIAQFFAGAFLSEALLEQGHLTEAEQALNTIGITAAFCPPGPSYFAAVAFARLQRLRGNPQDALDAALRAQQICHAYDIRNPAVVDWPAETALALHALGRHEEASAIALEDLRLARQWSAPRGVGRALRINGLLQRGADEGLRLLHEAAAVLESSSARLEHAKALTDLGAALRRTGHRTDARPHLRRALDLATQCGATPLADRARTELAAAGGRPRRTELTGPDSLTPSEHRIAHLAATGATNRQIAQDLYITPKTVEVHLSAAYRKLGITTRTQLREALTTS